MRTITRQPIQDVIRGGHRVAPPGQALSIDLVREALEVMPFASRGEEIIDISEPVHPDEIDLLRRRSVM